ncbi:hypothetical protein Tsubulata_024233 [Turnera subulata]|uniref:Uncharacterized protein n=1 Tax=Turnera subulata TaxID=218843 RepID=A0A9Q0FD78_9ROSI|nr:hypothetical protein Tsubulata_024233 [Turnera subulata]
MQPSSLQLSSIPAHPFCRKPADPKTGFSTSSCRRRCIKMSAWKTPGAYGGGDLDGRLVDEDMIVLRKRIQEMKLMAGRDSDLPSHWMEWEKEYYRGGYNSDICEAVGILQSLLMNTRPSLALGMFALVTLSVPTSTMIIMFHLLRWLNCL